MSQSITAMVKAGQQYMQIWPMQPQLYGMFPECRVISATKFSIKVMPALSVLTVAVLVNLQGYDKLPQALAVGALFLSLPVQGLMWLGHRSKQMLPPSLKGWYLDIHYKMQMQGCALQSPKSKPEYRELARLLKTAFDELDKAFTKSWF
ncbi:terminus macrodomain insulation protein YfbV [uncultured Paraglaciecola sp.]|uniref:terminus macrodomain insulation protein YfbV n=1 Tax=uncultured Paraglaciecola sp. TaxID=1765024 RepID=UPI0026247EED|nr:terminus macrodomain insulation protein YfbV [uncultured Paraglaciecola sp.]